MHQTARRREGERARRGLQALDCKLRSLAHEFAMSIRPGTDAQVVSREPEIHRVGPKLGQNPEVGPAFCRLDIPYRAFKSDQNFCQACGFTWRVLPACHSYAPWSLLRRTKTPIEIPGVTSPPVVTGRRRRARARRALQQGRRPRGRLLRHCRGSALGSLPGHHRRVPAGAGPARGERKKDRRGVWRIHSTHVFTARRPGG